MTSLWFLGLLQFLIFLENCEGGLMDDFVAAARRVLKIVHLVILAGSKGALVLQLLDDTKLEIAPLGAMRGANLGLNDGWREVRIAREHVLVHHIGAHLL